MSDTAGQMDGNRDVCVVCGLPMIAILKDQTTHPCCHADPYYRPADQPALLADAQEFEMSSNRLIDLMNQRGASTIGDLLPDREDAA